MTDEARRVEFHLGDEHIITIEVDFADRGSVKQRQREQAKAEQAANERPGRATPSPDTLSG